MAYRWVGLDADGHERRSHNTDPATFWPTLLSLLDAGFTAMSVVDETSGEEVAGIQDMGGGHSEAWVKN